MASTVPDLISSAAGSKSSEYGDPMVDELAPPLPAPEIFMFPLLVAPDPRGFAPAEARYRPVREIAPPHRREVQMTDQLVRALLRLTHRTPASNRVLFPDTPVVQPSFKKMKKS